MIHITLPMRPRDSSANLPYLVTPLSVFTEKLGKKILCITGNKSITPDSDTENYLQMIGDKIGLFDSIYTDFSVNFIDFIKNVIPSLPISIEKKEISICKCGSYEELSEARKFNLKLLNGLLCKKCNEPISQEFKQVLMFETCWSKNMFESMLPQWVENDFNHFLGRQVGKYLFCKNKEKIIINYHGQNHGIRYQFQWALLMLYVARIEHDNEITLHYVNRVQDKAFFVSSITKMLNPDLRINMRALPVIWPSEIVKIADSTDRHISILSKGLKTKRKEIKI